MLLTIDSYYSIPFYKETREALKNNSVEFKEFISIKPPYQFFFDVQEKPVFINYDVVAASYSKFLVNIIKALKPNDDYIYQRRESYTGPKAIAHYAINDALGSGQETGEGIFFSANKEEILRISQDYPRKLYFLGRYFNRKYKVFFSDNLIIKNYIDSKDILVEGSGFKSITSLEAELNYKIFKLQDRLEKLSQTPYVLSGRFHSAGSVRPELSDMYVLT